MKILFVTSNPFIGGTETFIMSLSKDLIRLGNHVIILNIWKDSQMKKIAQDQGLDYTELDSTSRHISIKNMMKIVNMVRSGNYSIVMGFGIRVSLITRWLKLFWGKTPLVIGLRGLDNWRKWYHVLPDRLSENLCDLFIANSHAVLMKRQIREKTSPHKMIVIENGIDCNFFKPSPPDVSHNVRKNHGIPEDAILVVSVGNLRIQKGFDFLLDTIDIIDTSAYKLFFLIIGEGPLQPIFEQRIKNNGKASSIIFAGRKKDVRSYLMAADIFVLPSREEGMPRALMEAMSMQRACIATNVGGNAEVLDHGVNGLLCNFGDHKSLASYIIELSNSPDYRNHLGKNARKKIESHFCMSAISKKYHELFLSISSISVSENI